MTGPSERISVCSFVVSEFGEERQECGRKAVALVSWPTSLARKGEVTYCRVHYRSVESMLDMAIDITYLADTDAP